MRIFLSSTCYDLPDFRARIARYLREHGHTPMLSDTPEFPVPLGQHRHDVCVEHAGKADLLIIVIDRRYGAPYVRDPSISVTWAEMRSALANNVRVRAFVRQSVYDERMTWKKNPDDFKPAHCDKTDTFRLLDEIQKAEPGIWCQAFNNVEQVVDHLDAMLQVDDIQRSIAPAQPKLKTFPSSRLKKRTYDFVKTQLGKTDRTFELSRSEIEQCLAILPEGSALMGYLVDLMMLPYTPDALMFDDPIRPGDDDGSSWYCERRLTAEGHAVRQELAEILDIME